MSCNLFAEAKAKFKFPPGPEIEDYAMKQDFDMAKVEHQVTKDQVQKERDAGMDHKQVIEAEKVAAAATHTDSEAAKEKKKKHHLGDITRSHAKEVAISILTGDDQCGQCVIKSTFASVPPLPQSWLIMVLVEQPCEPSQKGGSHVCMDCQTHKFKCVWPMGHPPGPKEASTSGTFVTDMSCLSCPSLEAIHEVAKAIQVMSDQQAELGRQQAKNSCVILSMSQHALNVIDQLASVIMEEVCGILTKGGAQSGGVAFEKKTKV